MDKIRQSYLDKITEDFKIVPIVALLGPRQCGKTTIARQFAKVHAGPIHYFDLEDYMDLAKLTNPKLALESLYGLVIIDEIQQNKDLFPLLRVLVDRSNNKVQFLTLESTSRDLLQSSSETLTGRIAYITVSPFSVEEVGHQRQLWTHGGFPKAFLAESDAASSRWLQIYIQTYFEKDLAFLGINLPPMRILRLWSMIVHYHGRVINYANMAQFMDISVLKIKNYLMFLEGTFMIRILHPWYDDLEKRLVKTPKLYIRDAGIYHSLLSIRSYDDLLSNTHIGQSWEGFALEEVTKILSIRSEECYFWSTHQQAELDLFINLNGKRIGFEFKTSDRPSVTKSMRSAMGYLKLDQLFIVTPVEETFLLEEKVTVLALKDCLKTLQSVPKNTNNRLTPHIRVLQ